MRNLVRDSPDVPFFHVHSRWRVQLASLTASQRANIWLPNKTRERTTEGVVYRLDLLGVANAAEGVDIKYNLATSGPAFASQNRHREYRVSPHEQ